MDEISWLRFFLAFAFVLGLIGVGAFALRRFGGRLGMPVTMGATKRLKVVEIAPLGPRHRLVLVRRDAVEHLLVLTPEGAQVVEHGVEHA